jgi:nucleoside triphosphate pyrophosphatase
VLTLASRSPQRKAILEQLGIEFRVEPADVEELTDGDPREVVVENAVRKARAVEAELVLGADTEVFLDGRIFGKAESEEVARAFLAALSGRTHEVWGGIALREGDEVKTAYAVTKVTFADVGADLMAWYLASGEWRDRAGAYAIQGRGSALVEAVEGDFWNVVGLPVPEFLRLGAGLLTP